jgi:hypothetical protein
VKLSYDAAFEDGSIITGKIVTPDARVAAGVASMGNAFVELLELGEQLYEAHTRSKAHNDHVVAAALDIVRKHAPAPVVGDEGPIS